MNDKHVTPQLLLFRTKHREREGERKREQEEANLYFPLFVATVL